MLAEIIGTIADVLTIATILVSIFRNGHDSTES